MDIKMVKYLPGNICYCLRRRYRGSGDPKPLIGEFAFVKVYRRTFYIYTECLCCFNHDPSSDQAIINTF